MKKTYVLYHDNCPDGFTSAYIAWKVFGYEATYIPVHYGNPPPEIESDTVLYILDFSYTRDVLLKLCEKCYGVVVLDHHKTAEANLKDLDYPKLCLVFDMDKCGAHLTWEHFHPHAPIPSFIYFIEDRDLWKWELEGSKEFSAALGSYDWTFEIFDKYFNHPQDLIKQGGPILRFKEQCVKRICENGYINNDGVPEVISPIFQSEIGHYLCKNNPQYSHTCIKFKTKEGKWVHSLRSIGDFDVSELAKSRGGGGHKNAAGYTTSD